MLSRIYIRNISFKHIKHWSIFAWNYFGVNSFELLLLLLRCCITFSASRDSCTWFTWGFFQLCLGLEMANVPISLRTSCRYPMTRFIVWSRETSKPWELNLENDRLLWILTVTSATLLPMCLSNSKTMQSSKLPISRVPDLTRFHDKTYWILKRDLGYYPEIGIKHDRREPSSVKHIIWIYNNLLIKCNWNKTNLCAYI